MSIIIIISIYSYLSRDIPTDLSVFLQGALTKYIIECVDHEVMWHCEYQEEQSSTWQQLNMIVSVSRNGENGARCGGGRWLLSIVLILTSIMNGSGEYGDV